jgi:hypothetical protein
MLTVFMTGSLIRWKSGAFFITIGGSNSINIRSAPQWKNVNALAFRSLVLVLIPIIRMEWIVIMKGYEKISGSATSSN